MNPSQRLHLEKRIADEGFTELAVHGQEPQYINPEAKRIWTMDESGEVSPRCGVRSAADSIRAGFSNIWIEAALTAIERTRHNPLGEA